MSNSALLVNRLESLPLLDGRYESLQCVSIDRATGQRRGCFSLVFKAFDCAERRTVALKFYDIDPQNLTRTYRKAAFHREHEILQVLLNDERCLQLASSMRTYELEVRDPLTNIVFKIPCEFFAVDWLDGEVDEYFERQEHHTATDKLHLFNEIVLAVEALHRHEVFHRDLKTDNLRAYTRALKRIVVAIDLGTAARRSTPAFGDYAAPVGALFYAPPESFCQFANDRQIAHQADVYALGCLLFELFNIDYHYRALRTVHPTFDAFLAAMQAMVLKAADPAQRLTLWKKNIGLLSKGISVGTIDQPGHSVPPAIVGILNEALEKLTHPNFLLRARRLEGVRSIIWSGIRCLENEREYRRRLEQLRERRRRRLERIQAREQRLRQFLANESRRAIQ